MADIQVTALTQLGTVANGDVMYIVDTSDGTSKHITASQLSDLFVVLARQVATGTGLTGGGDLSADRTLAIASGGVDTLQLADLSVTTGKIVDANVTEAKLSATAVGGGQVYFGRVASGGTATRLPSGWTSAKNSTGNYTVTHSLGDTNYVLQANSVGSVFMAQIFSIATNSFEIRTFDNADASVDGAFHFVMLRY